MPDLPFVRIALVKPWDSERHVDLVVSEDDLAVLPMPKAISVFPVFPTPELLAAFLARVEQREAAKTRLLEGISLALDALAGEEHA